MILPRKQSTNTIDASMRVTLQLSISGIGWMCSPLPRRVTGLSLLPPWKLLALFETSHSTLELSCSTSAREPDNINQENVSNIPQKQRIRKWLIAFRIRATIHSFRFSPIGRHGRNLPPRQYSDRRSCFSSGNVVLRTSTLEQTRPLNGSCGRGRWRRCRGDVFDMGK